MKIAMGADHAGCELKQRLSAAVAAAGHEVVDCGTDGTASVDYPDFAEAVARSVAEGRVDRGILVCGTGIGMSITANKVPGVRAAKANDPEEARLSREHNDANVLCLGARIVDHSVAEEAVRAFLEGSFEGGRHGRRVDKIRDLDAR